MGGDDDFLSLFTDTLANVSGMGEPAPQEPAPLEPAPLEPEPMEAEIVEDAPAPPVKAKGKVVYVGFDDATRNVFKQNLADKMPFVETADLQQIKAMMLKNEIALLVFDGTSFIKPGIPVTKFIKEKGLPIKVAHVYAPQRVTEEYEKYRQYHTHIQPDYQEFTDEIFVIVDKIKKDMGLQ